MTRRRLLSHCLSLFSTSPSASIVSNTIGFHCPSLLLSQGQAMRLTVLWESGSLRQLHTHSLFSLASTLRNLLLTPSHFHKLTIFLLCFHRLQQRATTGKSASSSRLQLLSHAENSNSDMHTCWGSLGEKVSMCVCVCVCTGLTHCVGVCLQVGLFAYEHKLTLLMRRMCPSYFLVWCSLPQGLSQDSLKSSSLNLSAPNEHPHTATCPLLVCVSVCVCDRCVGVCKKEGGAVQILWGRICVR